MKVISGFNLQSCPGNLEHTMYFLAIIIKFYVMLNRSCVREPGSYEIYHSRKHSKTIIQFYVMLNRSCVREPGSYEIYHSRTLKDDMHIASKYAQFID